jgi:hypothetical protein
MAGPWSEWTHEEWINASFCEECGLPLLEVENEEGGAGTYICVYCTWMEDEEVIYQQKIKAALDKVSEAAELLEGIYHE